MSDGTEAEACRKHQKSLQEQCPTLLECALPKHKTERVTTLVALPEIRQQRQQAARKGEQSRWLHDLKWVQ
jgi:hypothetical protein